MNKLSVYTDEYFMNEALKQAQKAYEEGEVPVGAVIVCRNQIIAKAYNQTERLDDGTAHAEMLAITIAEHHLGTKYLNDCILYVTLEPCVMCAGATFWTQLGKIVYGAKDVKRGYSSIDQSIIHPKSKVSSGILAKECGEVVTNFFEKLRGK